MSYCAKGFIHLTQWEQLMCYWWVWLLIIIFCFIIMIKTRIKKQNTKYPVFKEHFHTLEEIKELLRSKK